MPLITMTDTGRTTDTMNATVRVDRGTPHPITVTPPFNDADEARLPWTFEEHPRGPFTQQVRAHQAAERLVADGEALFAQVFRGTPAISADDQIAVRGGVQTWYVDTIGSPNVHQRPWDALREPGGDPFVRQAPRVQRTQTAFPRSMAIQPLPTIRLLSVTARPRGRRDVGYRTISRPLIDRLRQVQAPVQVDLVRPETDPALVEPWRPSEQAHGVGDDHLVHVDLHGVVLTYHALAQVGGVSPHTSRVLRTVTYSRPCMFKSLPHGWERSKKFREP